MFPQLQDYISHKRAFYDKHLCLGCKVLFIGLDKYVLHLECCQKIPPRGIIEARPSAILSNTLSILHETGTLGDSRQIRALSECGHIAEAHEASEVLRALEAQGIQVEDNTEILHTDDGIEYHIKYHTQSIDDGTHSQAFQLMASEDALGISESNSAESHHLLSELRKLQDQLKENQEAFEAEKATLNEELENLQKCSNKKEIQKSIDTKAKTTKYIIEQEEDVDGNALESRDEEGDKEVVIHCEVCDKTCFSEINFQRHALTNDHKEKLSECRDGRLLKEGVQKMLLTESKYQCRICNFYCNRDTDIDYHLKSPLHREISVSLGHPFICEPCNAEVLSNKSMRRHIQSVNHIKKMKSVRGPCIISMACKEIDPASVEMNKSNLCPICDYVASSSVHLQEHVNEKHQNTIRLKFWGTLNQPLIKLPNITKKKPGDKKFRKCKFCDFRSRVYKEFRMHIMDVHGDQLYRCEPCNLKFYEENDLKRHLNSRNHRGLSDGLGAHVCRECGAQFPEEKRKLLHEYGHTQFLTEEQAFKSDPFFGIPERFHKFIMSIHNKKSRGIIDCPECGASHPKNRMYPHLRSHDNIRPFKCTLCTSDFHSAFNMRAHLKCHLGIREIKCDQCSREFTKRAELKLHKLKVHPKGGPDENKKCMCSHCAMCFFNVSQLRKHEAIHGVKQFKCDYDGCNMDFYRSSELKRHVARHDQTKSLNNKCDICGWEGQNKRDLSQHFLIHMDERNRYKCEYCQHTSSVKMNLIRHLRGHINAKPYECHYCDYSCSSFNYLRVHIMDGKTHKGKPVYPCQHCTFGTDKGKNFRHHLITVHNLTANDIGNLHRYAGLYKPEKDGLVVPSGQTPLYVKSRGIRREGSTLPTLNTRKPGERRGHKPKQKCKEIMSESESESDLSSGEYDQFASIEESQDTTMVPMQDGSGLYHAAYQVQGDTEDIETEFVPDEVVQVVSESELTVSSMMENQQMTQNPQIEQNQQNEQLGQYPMEQMLGDMQPIHVEAAQASEHSGLSIAPEQPLEVMMQLPLKQNFDSSIVLSLSGSDVESAMVVEQGQSSTQTNYHVIQPNMVHIEPVGVSLDAHSQVKEEKSETSTTKVSQTEMQTLGIGHKPPLTQRMRLVPIKGSDGLYREVSGIDGHTPQRKKYTKTQQNTTCQKSKLKKSVFITPGPLMSTKPKGRKQQMVEEKGSPKIEGMSAVHAQSKPMSVSQAGQMEQPQIASIMSECWYLQNSDQPATSGVTNTTIQTPVVQSGEVSYSQIQTSQQVTAQPLADPEGNLVQVVVIGGDGQLTQQQLTDCVSRVVNKK